MSAARRDSFWYALCYTASRELKQRRGAWGPCPPPHTSTPSQNNGSAAYDRRRHQSTARLAEAGAAHAAPGGLWHIPLAWRHLLHTRDPGSRVARQRYFRRPVY